MPDTTPSTAVIPSISVRGEIHTIHHVKTDTILRLRHDTITLYRYAERKDTSAVVSQADKTTVKERTPFWLTLLKWLVPIGVLGAVVWFFMKWWRGR